MVAKAAISSLLVVCSFLFFEITLVITDDITTNGYVMNIIDLMVKNAVFDNPFQYLAPMVFGIISVITRIRIVRIADTMPKYASPKTRTACAPTPAAPMV